MVGSGGGTRRPPSACAPARIAIHAVTPKDIATRLHKEIADIAQQPTFAKVFDNLGVLPGCGTAEELGAFYSSDYRNRKALAARLGISVQ